jgi:Capsule polysaccharide export protein
MKSANSIRSRSYLGAVLGFGLMVAAPTALAGLYYHFVAADRYVTEFRYSVRGGAMMQDGGGGGILGGGGGLIFAGDSFVLEDYLISAQALLDVEQRVPVRDWLAKDGGGSRARLRSRAAPRTVGRLLGRSGRSALRRGDRDHDRLGVDVRS